MKSASPVDFEHGDFAPQLDNKVLTLVAGI
jgi:hypothetical protein